MSTPETISAAFLSARREARALDAFPGEVPSSLDAAYAVQARAIKDWGEPVVGFKVGGIPESWRERYPDSWLAGPVFHSHVIRADGQGTMDVPVYHGGFAAYEPELVFRVEGLQTERPHIETVEQATAFITAVHIGAEIASSPLATLNALGPGSIISDFGNQAAVVIGPDIGRDWLSRLGDIEVTTSIDRQTVGKTRVKSSGNGPLGALRFLLNHLRNAPYNALPDALWVSSGAITGVHEAPVGSTCCMVYEGLGVIGLRMVAKTGFNA